MLIKFCKKIQLRIKIWNCKQDIKAAISVYPMFKNTPQEDSYFIVYKAFKTKLKMLEDNLKSL